MENIGVHNGTLRCKNCGEIKALNLPIPIEEFNDALKEFTKLHRKCENLEGNAESMSQKSIDERAKWWLKHGDVGNSSMTMWQTFQGMPTKGNHPYDPDDFARCYCLLKLIPEWKAYMHKLKKVSWEWSNLVDNWDELTEKYEQNVKERWKNYKKIKMYEFMQALLDPRIKRESTGKIKK